MFAKRSPQQVVPPVHEGSRDPARPPFGLPHSGGVLVGEPTRLTGAAEVAIKPPSFGTFAFTRALLLWTYSIQKGGKRDETRSNRYRKRGLFGFNRLGGGGQCTSQYQPKHLPGHARSAEGAVGSRSRPE